MATVIDARDDLRGEMALSQMMGQNIGDLFQQLGKNAEMKKERQVGSMLTKIMADEGLTPQQRVQKMAQVPGIEYSKYGQNLINNYMHNVMQQSDPAYQLGLKATQTNIEGDVQRQDQSRQLFPGILATQEQDLEGGALMNTARQLQNQQDREMFPLQRILTEQGIRQNTQQYGITEEQAARDREMYPINRQSVIDEEAHKKNVRPLEIQGMKAGNQYRESMAGYNDARGTYYANKGTGNEALEKAYSNALTQLNKTLDDFGDIKPGMEEDHAVWRQKAKEIRERLQNAPQSTQTQPVQQAGPLAVQPQAGRVAPGQMTVTATNPQTGQRIISYDGGQTWQSLQ